MVWCRRVALIIFGLATIFRQCCSRTLRASSSTLSSRYGFVQNVSLQDPRHPQTQQVDTTPQPQSLWRDRSLMEGETHRWKALARSFESNLQNTQMLVFVQGNLGTRNAADLFFKVTFLLVIVLMFFTALWILCHSHTGHSELGDSSSTKPTTGLQQTGRSNQEVGSSHPPPHVVSRETTPQQIYENQMKTGHRQAFRKYDVDELPEDEKKVLDDFTAKFMSLESGELVEKLGLSGYALMDLATSSGVSKLPVRVVMPGTALQAWILQFCILFYMLRRVVRMASLPPVEKNVPFSIIFSAIYLHFMNCINDLPFSMSIVRYIKDLHTIPADYMIAMPVFLMDGLIIPVTSLTIGALYLCTSLTVADVILNSCAVAFVGSVDNWLLELVGKVNQASGRYFEIENEKNSDNCTVFIPVQPTLVKFMSWWLCTIPVVPCLFSTSIGYLGIYILHL